MKNEIDVFRAPEQESTPPTYIRLPKQSRHCPHSGLTRSHLNKLILPCPENRLRPPVESFVVSQPGKRRGVRLIKYASLMAYLSEQEKKQKPCVKANDNSVTK